MNVQPLPCDLEAEKAVIGSLLLDRDAIVALAPMLQAAHFSNEQLGQIYEAVRSCYDRRVPPDLVSVAAELRRAGRLDDNPDADPHQTLTPTTLVNLQNGAMTSVHAAHYAGLVTATAQRRQLIMAAQQQAARAYAGEDDPATLIAQAERELLAIGRPAGRRGLRPISESVSTLYDRATTGIAPGIPTGLRDLDEVTGGLHPGRLYLLAGLPGHGKSALAGQIVHHIAKKTPAHRCQVFSLEMTAEEWAGRYVAAEAQLDNRLISNNAIHEVDLTRFSDAAGMVAELPIVIDDGTAPTVDEIRMTALQDMAEHGPVAVVVIDPLLLIARPDPRQTDAAQIAAIEAALKNLARDMNAAVILLHHLNKEGSLYQGGGKQADCVLLLSQPQLTDPDTSQKGIAQLIVQKNRGGKTGDVLAFKFFGETTTFRDLERFRVVSGYGEAA